jgi:hypothetical protein
MAGGAEMQRCDGCGGAAEVDSVAMWLPLGMCLLVAVCP